MQTDIWVIGSELQCFSHLHVCLHTILFKRFSGHPLDGTNGWRWYRHKRIRESRGSPISIRHTFSGVLLQKSLTWTQMLNSHPHSVLTCRILPGCLLRMMTSVTLKGCTSKAQYRHKEKWAFQWFPLYRTSPEGTAAYYDNRAPNERRMKGSTWPVRVKEFLLIKMKTQKSLQSLYLYRLWPTVIISRICPAHI